VSDRRLDPLGKGALFGPEAAAAPDRVTPGEHDDGRTALFSGAPRRPGTVVIECSICKVRSRVSLLDLAILLASGSAWVPLRARHQHWLRCPACHRRRWCRIGWTE